MPVERQCQQWPHRREAMLRAARGDEDYDYSKYEKSFSAPAAPKTPQNYSPTQYNSPLHPARPEVSWQSIEPEQNVLPMDFPTENAAYGPEHALPVDRQPNTLYRGIKLYLDHPDAAHIRRMVYGDALEQQHDGNEWNEYRTDWGSTHRYGPSRSSTLPGMPSSQEMAAPGNPFHPALGQAILDYMSQYKDSTGLGRHWSIIQGNGAWSKDHGSLDPRPHLPVELTGEWLGHGEDPERTETGWDKKTEADFPSEKEITLLPGAPINITDLRVQHPHTDEWHSVLPEPQHRTAAGPFNLHDTDYYRGRTMVPVHGWDFDSNPLGPVAGNKAYNFPATGFNPPSYSKGRPRLTWESTEPEQDILPMDFPTETTIDSGVGPDHPNYREPHSLPYDRKPLTLYRGLAVDLADPRAAHIRRTLYGPEHEDTFGHYGHPPLPGMPSTEELADHWNAYDYENPELGPALLDHLSNHYDHHSLGQHWSIYPNIGQEFGADGNGRMGLPLNVVLSAQWRGAGEDPYRRATMGNWPHEGEITLLPDAPLHVTNVHIQHPMTEKWHSVLPEPQHRQAGRVVLAYDDDEDDEEYYEGYDQEVHPLSDYTPMFPGFKHRPIFYDGDLERTVHHFSPHEINPASDGVSRPYVRWKRGNDPEHPTLDLDLPGNAVDIGAHLPTDRHPVRLYRGLSVDLDHPDAHRLRRLIHPQRHDNREDGAGFQRRPLGWGRWQEEPHLWPGMENKTLRRQVGPPQDYDDDEVRQLVLDRLLHGGDGGLGTHWSTDLGQAQMFARYNSAATGRNILPVVLHHDWMGSGEDPYRRGTEGEWTDEQEITKLPGAAVNLVGMDIFHDTPGGLSRWHTIYEGDPLRHQAARS